MKNRVALFAFVGAAMCAVTGCQSSTTQPSGSASVTAPRGVVPAPNASLRFLDQPITLSIANAVATQGTSTYTFEVASDSGFASKVATMSDVAEGASGQTSVKLGQLPGGADYYWHARTSSGGTQGVFGPTYKFTVGPAVTLGAPVLVGPVLNIQVGSLPALTIGNAAKTGPAGPVTYRIEISTNPSFAPDVMDTTVPEGVSRTVYQVPNELPAEVTLYWRVTASDVASGVSGPVSSTGSFVTALAIDLSRVVYLNSPNVSGWKRTGFLQSVEQDGSEAAGGPMCTKFADPGWPDSPWVYGDDPTFGVFANQWYFARIGGTWYGGAGEWIYRSAASTCKAGQGTTTIGPDSGFGQPFASWQPKAGELVGFMVSSVARAGSIKRTVDERTQVIVQPWRDTSRGSSLAAPSIYGVPTATLR
jgi:hypothetical protein